MYMCRLCSPHLTKNEPAAETIKGRTSKMVKELEDFLRE